MLECFRRLFARPPAPRPALEIWYADGVDEAGECLTGGAALLARCEHLAAAAERCHGLYGWCEANLGPGVLAVLGADGRVLARWQQPEESA